MEYNGRYNAFDLGRVNTYPLRTRSNKVTLDDLVRPEDLDNTTFELPGKTCDEIEIIAHEIVSCRQAGKLVVVFTGAHLIKNGLGLLLADMVKRGLVSLVAGNGATAIHDFELALIGQTSENVPDALSKGRFGMAREFAYFNYAMSVGNKYKLGLGEALGRTICDEDFRREVIALAEEGDLPDTFAHPKVGLLAACYENNVPFTIHVGIGTDVIDQHPSFDGQAKGGCSGRDFLIYTNEIAKLTNGGVVLNIGSAVTGPEVLLKAVSIATNTGSAPNGILTADFDLRDRETSTMNDESSQGYYFRDQKSIITRIPKSFAGKGFYIQGNQKQTFPLLYKKTIHLSQQKGVE
ncbi:MAG: hypothetical protein JXA81_12875 [Sedimentisphaerales bacterium]|nr:hypothetical protein [Sedimentisphaerales bacterium]